ncbi:MAG: hypothetical protein GXO40_04600 [Epsilonproteobacteria bacterium]|nr:hypothetical protein [Campylobacterota bacterium]
MDIDVVVIPIASPMLIGLYKDKKLFQTYTISAKTSDALPEIFHTLLDTYNIKNIIYVNGPGSYMAIKLAYIFFKTLQITNGIEIFAVDGFYFNDNQPIKALAKKSFVKSNGEIVLSDDTPSSTFKLPQTLNYQDFNTDIEPLYVLDCIN